MDSLETQELMGEKLCARVRAGEREVRGIWRL